MVIPAPMNLKFSTAGGHGFHWESVGIVSTWREVVSSLCSRKGCGHPEGVPQKHSGFQFSGCRECESLALLSGGIRENSSVGCDQVSDLLSPVVELGGEGERLRSIRNSHQQDLRNGGEWKGVLFGVAGESTPNPPHLSRWPYTVGMRPWNPRPKEMRIRETRMWMEVLLGWVCWLGQSSLSTASWLPPLNETSILGAQPAQKESVFEIIRLFPFKFFLGWCYRLSTPI